MRILATAVLLLAVFSLQTCARNVSVQGQNEKALRPNKHKHTHHRAHKSHTHHSEASTTTEPPSEPAAPPQPAAAAKHAHLAGKKLRSSPADGASTAVKQQTEHEEAAPVHHGHQHHQEAAKKQSSTWESISTWIGKEVQWLVGSKKKEGGRDDSGDQTFVIWGSDYEHAKNARPYTSLRAYRTQVHVLKPGEHHVAHKAAHKPNSTDIEPARPWWQIDAAPLRTAKNDVYALTEDATFPLVMVLVCVCFLFLCAVYYAFKGWLADGTYSEEGNADQISIIDSRRDGIFRRSSNGSARQHLLAARGVSGESDRDSATSHNSPPLSDSTGHKMPHLREWAVRNLEAQQQQALLQQQQQVVVNTQQQQQEGGQGEHQEEEEPLDIGMDEEHYLCVEMVIPPGNELILSVPEPHTSGGLCGARPPSAQQQAVSRYVFDKNGKKIVKVRGNALTGDGMRLTAAETGQSIARVRPLIGVNAQQQDGQATKSRPATSASGSTHANSTSPGNVTAVGGRRGSTKEPLCVMELVGADGDVYGEMVLSADGKRLTIYRMFPPQEGEDAPSREAVLVFLRAHSNPRDIQVVNAQSRRLVAQVGRFPWVIPRSSPVNALQQYQVRIGPGVDSSLVLLGCLAIDDAVLTNDIE